MKRTIDDLENKYSRFLALDIEFNPNIEQDSNLRTNTYLMANEDLSEIKSLNLRSDGKEEFKDLEPIEAKELMEKYNFPQIVTEWGLENESRVSKDEVKIWVSENKDKVNEINSLDYSDLKDNLFFNNIVIRRSSERDELFYSKCCENEYIKSTIDYMRKNYPNLENKNKDLADEFKIINKEKSFKLKNKDIKNNKEIER